VSWTGLGGAGLAVGGGLILAWAAAGRTPREVERGFDAFVAGWRRSHRLPDGSDPGGRVTLAWLRLPWWLGQRLAAAGVDPNRVTLAALWLALLAGWTAALGAGWAAAAGTLTLAAGLADGVDGAVAVLAGLGVGGLVTGPMWLALAAACTVRLHGSLKEEALAELRTELDRAHAEVDRLAGLLADARATLAQGRGGP